VSPSISCKSRRITAISDQITLCRRIRILLARMSGSCYLFAVFCFRYKAKKSSAIPAIDHLAKICSKQLEQVATPAGVPHSCRTKPALRNDRRQPWVYSHPRSRSLNACESQDTSSFLRITQIPFTGLSFSFIRRVLQRRVHRNPSSPASPQKTVGHLRYLVRSVNAHRVPQVSLSTPELPGLAPLPVAGRARNHVDRRGAWPGADPCASNRGNFLVVRVRVNRGHVPL